MEYSRAFLKSNHIYVILIIEQNMSFTQCICHQWIFDLCDFHCQSRTIYIYIYIACANITISRYARHARANWIMKIIANTLIFLITMFWRKCYAFVQVHLRCAKHYLYSFHTITNEYIGRYIETEKSFRNTKNTNLS